VSELTSHSRTSVHLLRKGRGASTVQSCSKSLSLSLSLSVSLLICPSSRGGILLSSGRQGEDGRQRNSAENGRKEITFAVSAFRACFLQKTLRQIDIARAIMRHRAGLKARHRSLSRFSSRENYSAGLIPSVRKLIISENRKAVSFSPHDITGFSHAQTLIRRYGS